MAVIDLAAGSGCSLQAIESAAADMPFRGATRYHCIHHPGWLAALVALHIRHSLELHVSTFHLAKATYLHSLITALITP
jgi:hypothetical protein